MNSNFKYDLKKKKLEEYLNLLSIFVGEKISDDPLLQDLLISINYWKEVSKIEVTIQKKDDSVEKRLDHWEFQRSSTQLNKRSPTQVSNQLNKISPSKRGNKQNKNSEIFEEDKSPNINESLRSNSKLILISQERCINCRMKKGITEECDHTLCENCLKDLFRQISKNSFLGRFKCKICVKEIKVNKYLKSDDLEKPRLSAIEQLRWKINQDVVSAYFTCRICQEESLVSESITLECNDRYCSSCFKAYLTSTIKSSNLKDLVCPSCQCEIKYDEIRANVDSTTFELYLVQTTRTHRPDDKNFYLKECAICNGFFEIPITSKIFKCPSCKNQYCPQCNNNHPSQTCAEYLSKNKPNLGNLEFINCPKCKEAIMIDDQGCNFMKCQWAGCNCYFCVLCNQTFDESFHFKHYTKSGPFGKTCNTLDGLPNN
jgi:hypothetical protein